MLPSVYLIALFIFGMTDLTAHTIQVFAWGGSILGAPAQQCVFQGVPLILLRMLAHPWLYV